MSMNISVTLTPNWTRCEDTSKPRNRSNIAITENGKSYIGINNSGKTTRTIRVDDCLITGHSNKCDYLLLDDTELKAYFIELKGCDVKHAAIQIIETISRLKKDLSSYNTFFARIVCSECPPNIKNTPQFLKLLRLIRDHNGDVKIKQKKLEEAI